MVKNKKKFKIFTGIFIFAFVWFSTYMLTRGIIESLLLDLLPIHKVGIGIGGLIIAGAVGWWKTR